MEKYFKKLTGKKCYLSPICLEDAAVYTKWFNDMEVIDGLPSVTWSLGLEKEKELLPNLAKEHNYAIVTQDGDIMIGNAGFMDMNNFDGTAELGIVIGNKEYWNKGFGEEAMRLLCDYGFNFLNLENIQLRVYAYNERAIACYKKIGFREIGKRRKAVKRKRQQFDLLYMDLLPGELK